MIFFFFILQDFASTDANALITNLKLNDERWGDRGQHKCAFLGSITTFRGVEHELMIDGTKFALCSFGYALI